MAQAEEKGWMTGRTRPVRVFLTEEEHALVRQAAALADRSVSRFSIEQIVEGARRLLGQTQEQPAPKKKGK
jgi:uncharacterized protein (DUF1778 family)